MFEFVNVFNSSLFLSGVISILCGFVVFFNNNKTDTSRSWLALNVLAGIWSIGYASMITTQSDSIALLSNWILHYGAIMLPAAYFYFAASVTDQRKILKLLMPIIFVVTGFFLFMNPSPYFVEGVIAKGPFDHVPEPGPLYILFTGYFFLMVILITSMFSRASTKAKNKIKKDKFRLITLAFIAGVAGGGSVFLYTYNYFFPPYTFFLFVFYTLTLTYILLRKDFFDVKVISTEILTFILWIILLLRMIFSGGETDLIFNAITFTLVFILGIFLVKSVVKEVESREKIEKLARELKKANIRLQELDELKTQFLSIASHQFRSPLTAIKGYTSNILDGTYGELSEKLKIPMDRIFTSANHLALIVDDFLNLSRIEQGRMDYEMEKVDLKEFVGSAVDEQRAVAEKKGVELNYERSDECYDVMIDIGKFKQVVTNLIDNALKYTPKGSVDVSLEHLDGFVRLSVADTGVGVPKDELDALFGQFKRAKNANKANVIGTGLGLYIAKEIVKAHKGNIWVESEGEGKGSTFIVELPHA